MIKTVKLAGYELRRFKGPLPVIALLFLLLVPTLYGGLYLWSNWDPYGKSDQIPVAVVNQDVPVQVEGKSVDAGARLVTELQADPIFDWQFVDEAQAQQGLADGTYYLIVTIPPDFSQNLVSGATDDPSRAEITVQRDDANGYLVGVMEAVARTQLRTRSTGRPWAPTLMRCSPIWRRSDRHRRRGHRRHPTGRRSRPDGDRQHRPLDRHHHGEGRLDATGDRTCGRQDGIDPAGHCQLGRQGRVGRPGHRTLSTLESNSAQLRRPRSRLPTAMRSWPALWFRCSALSLAPRPAVGQAGQRGRGHHRRQRPGDQSLSPQVAAANNALIVLKTTNTHEELNPSIDALSAALEGITATNSDLTAAAGQASQAAVAVNSAAESANSVQTADLSSASADVTALATGSAQVASGATR